MIKLSMLSAALEVTALAPSSLPLSSLQQTKATNKLQKFWNWTLVELTQGGSLQGGKENFFQVVENGLRLRQIPVREELVNNGKILPSFRESGEQKLDVALGLFLEHTT